MSDVPDDTLPEVMSKRMTTIPDEIISDILSRLPVTSVLRLRCVCKLWKVLIESPHVINLHLNHSRRLISNNSNLNKHIIILRDYFNYKTFVNSPGLKQSLKINSRVVYSEDLDSLTNNRGQPNFSKLSHPFESLKSLEILGSCDGLLVLSKTEDDIILWNPSIKRFKLVPTPGIGFPMHLRCFIVYGFGYDCLSDDYKLVRIVQSYEPSTAVAASEVKVYSVKRNCWKQVADFPYYLKVRWGNGVFVNGALHWIVGTTSVMKHWSDNDDCLVGAFDLQTEDYRLVPLPIFANYGQIHIISLGALGGCLTDVCEHNDNEDPFGSCADFWVMKEYGVVESWSLLFTFSFEDFSQVACWRYSDMIMPIAYSDCGGKVLVGFSTGGLVWYDLDTKSFDKQEVENIYPKPEVKNTIFGGVNFDESYKYLEVHICLKSLVLLNDSISDCDLDMVTKTEEEKYGKYRSPSSRMEFLRSWFGCDDD